MRRLWIALVTALVLAACGGGSSDDTVVIEQLGADVLPATLGGLRVEREDVEPRIAGVDRSYVEATGLYVLREGEALQGTLQVSRLSDDADIDDPAFRLSIVNQIGSTEPKAFRMGDDVVYLTASKRQAVAVFFSERSFGVLSTLETYEHGRSLLREVLELDL